MKEIINLYKKHFPKGSTELIEKAYKFAKEVHHGQERASGEEYFVHCKKTAENLASWGLGDTTIAAGLLHDVVDDTNIELEQIEKEFGKDVALLVRGVSKVGKLKLRQSAKMDLVENLRSLFLVMAKDIRVVFVKLADRLHNMQTLEYLPDFKQKRIAKETLEIYAPLAERLGMGEIKGQLEDLAFPYVYEKESKEIEKIYEAKGRELEHYLENVKRKLRENLERQGIKAQIDGRAKHCYSLYRKLLLKNNDIEKIYDLVALRILVNNIADCYKALGVVHLAFRPAFALAPIKDYIANPKTNGYRSIHTNVLGDNGYVFEVQIRTFQMHEEAEYGLAAHWHYSESKKSGRVSDVELEKGLRIEDEYLTQLEWVKRLASWQQSEKDPEEYLKALKTDIFNKRIFVFTPDADVIDLPQNSTPIDFAYQIHSDLAEGCSGVKINGKIAPISTKLKNGDIVEIIVSKSVKGPRRDWLEFVVTTEARSRIKKALRSK